MRKAFFYLDCIEGRRFEGYTLGQTWNGWACPYFTEKVGKEIIESLADRLTFHFA